MCNQCGGCNPCSNCNSCDQNNTNNPIEKFVTGLIPNGRDLQVVYNTGEEKLIEDFFPITNNSQTDIFINSGELDIDNKLIRFGYSNNGDPLEISLELLFDLINDTNSDNCCELEVRELEGDDFLYYNNVQVYRLTNSSTQSGNPKVRFEELKNNGDFFVAYGLEGNNDKIILTRNSGSGILTPDTGIDLMSATIYLDSSTDNPNSNSYQLSIYQTGFVQNTPVVQIFELQGTNTWVQVYDSISIQTIPSGISHSNLVINNPNMFPGNNTKRILKIVF